MIARFGGDEFVLLLPGNSISDAEAFAKRLHKLVAGLDVQGIPVTVSIGIASSEKPQNFDDLFKEADSALYRAKASGRDTTSAYLTTENRD